MCFHACAAVHANTSVCMLGVMGVQSSVQNLPFPSPYHVASRCQPSSAGGTRAPTCALGISSGPCHPHWLPAAAPGTAGTAQLAAHPPLSRGPAAGSGGGISSIWVKSSVRGPLTSLSGPCRARSCPQDLLSSRIRPTNTPGPLGMCLLWGLSAAARLRVPWAALGREQGASKAGERVLRASGLCPGLTGRGVIAVPSAVATPGQHSGGPAGSARPQTRDWAPGLLGLHRQGCLLLVGRPCPSRCPSPGVAHCLPACSHLPHAGACSCLPAWPAGAALGWGAGTSVPPQGEAGLDIWAGYSAALKCPAGPKPQPLLAWPALQGPIPCPVHLPAPTPPTWPSLSGAAGALLPALSCKKDPSHPGPAAVRGQALCSLTP